MAPMPSGWWKTRAQSLKPWPWGLPLVWGNYTVPTGEDWQQRYLSLRQSLQALLEENPAQI